MSQQYEQPYPSGAAGGPPVGNNIGWAVAAIFFFWPLAIPAFIASGKVNDLAARGDLAGAQYQSGQARKWGRLALFIGIGLLVLYCLGFIGLIAVGAAGA